MRLHKLLGFYIIMKMNSKINKAMKLKKSQNSSIPEPTPLKEQTSKIQDRLETLKNELAMRKTMKNKQKQTSKSNTMTTWGDFKNKKQDTTQYGDPFYVEKTNRNGQNSVVSQDEQKLDNLLKQLKAEAHKTVIKNKYKVNGIQKLLSLSEDDIDQWKDVPVGFRIKIRKFINEHKKNQEKKQSNENDNDNDIEAIIKRRKQEKVYQPIMNMKVEQDVEDYINDQKVLKFQQINDENEDQLISSLNEAFLQKQLRRSIIKKQKISPNKQHHKNKVHWDQKVKQYNKETSKFKGDVVNTKFPDKNVREDIIKQENSIQSDKIVKNPVSYCWNCLKKIQNVKQVSSIKTFCKAECEINYQNNINRFKQVFKAETEFQQDNIQMFDLELM